MSNRTTKLSLLDIQRGGVIGIRVIKQITDDDGSIISSSYHRTSLEPDVDIKDQLGALDAGLALLNFPALGASERGQVETFVGHEHVVAIRSAGADEKTDRAAENATRTAQEKAGR